MREILLVFLIILKILFVTSRYVYFHPVWIWIPESELSITKVDTHSDENKRLHHTDQFKTSALVLRRGQHFLIDVHLATPFDTSRDSIILELWTTSKPRRYDRTLVSIPLVQYLDKRRWGMKKTSVEDTVLRLKINIPADCLIAKYNMRLMDNHKKPLYKHRKPIFILFNPWSTDDEVYMPNSSDLDEYILNDQGVIFQGSASHISPLRWYFGQFENVTLEAAFELLKTTRTRKRDSAREIARKLSAEVNANDDEGVLLGRWGSDFSGGTEPWAWTGSPAILEEYLKARKPVKYGQCWNYCGLTTTLLRTLGIPARAISNFNSAHDTDGNCTFDRYYDENGEFITHLSRDSTWNFHCWSDAWMERPDLPAGYGGWQAVDGTPQERSQGVYQVGPAPLRAIKEGNINMKHDVKFVFAEVNADTVYWGRISSNQEFKPIHVDRKQIGQNMSTKAVGRSNYARIDITEDYKYPEGSALEMISVKRVMHLTNNKLVSETPKDLKYTLQTNHHIPVGNDVILRLNIKNTGTTAKNVKVMVGGHVLTYNGVTLDSLPMRKSEVLVHSKTDMYHSVVFSAKQYLSYLKQEPRLRFHVFSTCPETGQIYVTETLVTLGRPPLVFEHFPSYWRRGNDLRFYIQIRNPLSVELTDCVLRLDGNIMEERLTLPQRNIPSHGFIQMLVHILPEYVGRKDVIATFTSKQLGGFRGSAYIDVHQ